MSTARPGRRGPDRQTLVAWAAVLNAELFVVLLYVLFASEPPRDVRGVLLLAYPFVWLNVSMWAVRRTTPPAASGRRQLAAGALAAGYVAILAAVGGVIVAGAGDLATGLRVATVSLPPGYSPAVLYSGERVVVNLLPYQVVGYLALGYLVYVTALDVSGSLAAGVVGLFSCVSCSVPVLAALVSGVSGSAAAAVAVAGRSYGLSTVAFVATVLLLSWRPDAGDVARLRRRLGRA